MHSADNQVSISAIEFKQEQVLDLMNSIENKLSMLAHEDSIADFQPFKQSSPLRTVMTATKEKNNNMRLEITQLETSHRKQNNSQLGESRILSRINQMQTYYMEQIQKMASKIASLQFELQNVTKKNEQLREQNTNMKRNLIRKQKQQTQIINQKLEQVKAELIQRFAKQSQLHFEQHVRQMHAINEELVQQKTKRRSLQQEVLLIKNQKTNLQQFYRSLLENHKNMIRIDIEKSEKTVKNYSHHKSPATTKLDGIQIGTKKRAKKKQGSLYQNKKQQMTKQQMIPFLAKGIQELKDKLKIK